MRGNIIDLEKIGKLRGTFNLVGGRKGIRKYINKLRLTDTKKGIIPSFITEEDGQDKF